MTSRSIVAGALSLLAFVASCTSAEAFVHPGISHSLADLDRMKNNINVEPYKTAYTAFVSEGYSSYTNVGQGPYASESVGSPAQFAIRNDARVAHQNAIMWYITGDTRYRDNSIHIMMMWANTLTSFQADDMLTAGTAMFDFCNAGEIIRATGNGAWAAADITTFQNWLIAYLYPPLLYPGGSIAAGSLGPAGFGGLQIKGLLALGVFCDRTDIYNFGVSSVQHNGTSSYGLLEYIDPVSAQNYETQRDVGHPSGNLGAFAESFYVIYNQGQDLFGLSNNLLARANEVQAKFDLGWDLAPATWTTKDGVFRSKVSGDNRTPYDNLQSNLVYNIYHNVKGLDLPYTKMSSDLKFSQSGAFYYLVDSSGKVPSPPLIGEPVANLVRLYEDDLSGSYIANFGPGNYNLAALRAGGMQANNSGLVSTMRVPIGWTVIAYDGDNFTGNSITFTATLQNRGYANMVTLNFNDRLVSMKVTGGGTWPVLDGTYRLINRTSNKALDISGSSTASGTPAVQNTYANKTSELWRVENIGFGNDQFKLTNLNSGKVLEVLNAAGNDGAVVDQWTEVYATSPNLAVGGAASGNPGSAGEMPAQAFDGSTSTKWCKNTNGGTGVLQYQLSAPQMITQYRLVSANDVSQRDPRDWQFQGSNDGNAWTTLDTQTGQVFANRFQSNAYSAANATAYSYYRLNLLANNGGASYGLQLSEFGLYSSSITLAAGGTATASSGSGAEGATAAFDGSKSSKWCTTVAGSTGYLQYQFGSGIQRVVTQYKMTSANDVPGRDPMSWQFLGSNDGTSWKTLDTQTNQTFSDRFVTNTYNTTNTVAYAYYMLNITANLGGASQGIQLAELGLYSSTSGASYQRWRFAPVSGATYGTYNSITNVNSGKAATIQGNSSADGAAVLQSGYSATNNQQWTLQVP